MAALVLSIFVMFTGLYILTVVLTQKFPVVTKHTFLTFLLPSVLLMFTVFIPANEYDVAFGLLRFVALGYLIRGRLRLIVNPK